VTYVLDTNVISEVVRPRPDANVINWLDETDEDRLYLSVVALAELRRGVELMPPGRRRNALTVWLTEDLPARFDGRVLPVDRTVADAWGTVMARARRAGVGLSSMDGFFAATADVHGFTLVTRNVSDFRALGISLLNPWQSLSA
jgi:toxin FitB